MNAPMSYFDLNSNPVIYSKLEADSLRVVFEHVFDLLIPEFITIISTLIYVFRINWYCMIGMLPFFYILYYSVWKTRNTYPIMNEWIMYSLDLLRINEHEVLNGSATIRALGAEDYAIAVNNCVEDRWVSAWNMNMGINTWF